MLDPFAENLTATATALDGALDDLHVALTQAGIPFEPLDPVPDWYNTLTAATKVLETRVVAIQRAIDDRAQLLAVLDQLAAELAAVTQFDRPGVMIASIRDAQHLITLETAHKKLVVRTEARPARTDPPLDREERNRRPAPIYKAPPPPASKPDPPTVEPVDPPAPTEPDPPKPARETVASQAPADGR